MIKFLLFFPPKVSCLIYGNPDLQTLLGHSFFTTSPSLHATDRAVLWKFPLFKTSFIVILWAQIGKT